MKLLNNITAGKPKKLIKPILWTVLSNIVSILPFGLIVAAIQIIYSYFAEPTTPLNITALWAICGGLFVSMLLMFISEIPTYKSTYLEAYSVAAEGRAEVAEHIRKLPLGYISKKDPGYLGNMIMSDFGLIEHAIAHLVPQLIGAFALPLVAFVGLLFLDARMALVMFICLPLAVLLLWATRKIQRRISSKHMNTKIDMTNRLQEYLEGIRVIKAYNIRGKKFERLDTSMKNMMKESIRLEGFLGPIILGAIALVKAGLTLMILAGVHLLLGGSLNVVTFAAFIVIGTRVYDPLTIALTNYAELSYDVQAGERIVDLLEEPIMTGNDCPPTSHAIEFHNVTFGYDKSSVLNDVSFRLPESALTAIVGPSGSGKSTVLRLAARFYDPQEGVVAFGGADERRLEPERLFSRVSVVFQDVYLFQDTIENNIRYGKEDATLLEIEAAAKKACAHDFISKLPQGYQTLVGEGGSSLSGGERQRISIARAILKDAPIILLDEATASLDPENERDIQEAIESLVTGKTVAMVAHRLKTVAKADSIIVLEKGKVVEQGTHDELLSNQGLYKHLWSTQQNAQRWKLNKQ